jgi:hypothetical protein
MSSFGNKRSVDSYLSYITRNIEHKLLDRTRELYDQLLLDSSSHSSKFSNTLNALDCQFTEILLSGERQCMRKKKGKARLVSNFPVDWPDIFLLETEAHYGE